MNFKPNFITDDGVFEVMLDESILTLDKPTTKKYYVSKEITLNKIKVFNTRTERLSEKSLYYKENKGFYFKGSTSYWNKTPKNVYYLNELLSYKEK